MKDISFLFTSLIKNAMPNLYLSECLLFLNDQNFRYLFCLQMKLLLIIARLRYLIIVEIAIKKNTISQSISWLIIHYIA